MAARSDSAADAIVRLTTAQLIVGNDDPDPEMADFVEARALQSCIKQARLFVIEPELMLQIYETGEITMENHEPAPNVPSQLPFETVYVDAGYFDPTDKGDELLGYILSTRGGIFRAWTFNRDVEKQPFFLPLRVNGEWFGDDQAGAFVVPQIAAALNHQPPVASALSFGDRRLWAKLVKGSGMYPHPYYQVRTPAFTIDNAGVAPASQSRASPSYRFDSRAHQRLLCYRGPAPISERDRASLERRGYKVFGEALVEEWADAMARRGHDPQKAGEWIAVRLVNVREAIKGDARLPYVPSTRTL